MAVDLAKFAEVRPVEAPEPARTGGRVDLGRFGTETGPPESSGPATLSQEFRQGVRAGMESTSQSLFAVADIFAQGIGSQSMQEWAREGMKESSSALERLQPSIGTLSEIEDTSDFFKWATGMLGQQVPIMGSILAGGGVGGAVARGVVNRAVRNRVRDTAARVLGDRYKDLATGAELNAVMKAALRDPSTHRAMTSAVMKGSAAGAFPPGFGIMAGDIHSELLEAGIDAPGTAVLAGAGAAALNTLPVAVLMTRLFPGVERSVARSFVQDFARTAGIQASLEGPTELAQETIQLAARAFHDPSFDLTSPINRERVLTAAAAGALVGAVTGGAGEVVSATPRAARRVSDQIRQQNERTREFLSERAAHARSAAQEEADSLVPGANELRDAATNLFNQATEAALVRTREAVAGVRTQIMESLEVDNLGVDLESLVSRAEEVTRARVKAEVDVALEFMHKQIDAVREQAGRMPPEDRSPFLRQQLEAIRQDVQNFVNQRVQPIVEQAERQMSEEAETRNFGDDDEDIFTDFDDAGPPRELVRATIGNTTSRTRTVSGVSVTSRVRTRGDDAMPFTSREAAQDQIDRVRQFFPDVAEGAFAVDQRQDGWYIVIQDEGNAEAIHQRLRLLDGVEDSVARARALQPDKEGGRQATNPRIVSILQPGKDAPTRMDLPTLAFAGMDMYERAGGEQTGNFSADMLNGMNVALAQLLEAGFTFPSGAQALQGRVLYELGGRTERDAQGRARRTGTRRVTVSEARRLAGSRARGSDEPTPGDTPVFDLADPAARPDQIDDRTAGESLRLPIERQASPERTGPDDPGTSAQTGVTETEATQQRRQPPARTTKRAAKQWYLPDPRPRVSFGDNIPESTQAAVAQLVEDLLSLAGLKNRVFVVDKAGAEALAAASHPMANEVRAAAMDDPAGRIIMHGDDVVIYVADRILVDKRLGDEETARLNTLAVVGHEIGHLVEKVYYRNAPDALKSKLVEAWEKDGKAKVFEEWMADQFVGWLSDASTPRTAVDNFFRSVAQVLRQLFNRLRSKYGVTESYRQFIEGVTQKARGNRWHSNEWAQYFLNNGVVGRKWFATPETADFDTNQLKNAPAALAARIKQITDAWPTGKQAASRMWDTTLWLHDQVTASLNGSLRRTGLKAANRLADIFNRTPGTGRQQATYFNSEQVHGAIFSRKMAKILGRMTDDDKAAAAEALVALSGQDGAHTNQHAKAVVDLLRDLALYASEAGLPLDILPNYFPLVWNRQAVEANADAIRQKLVDQGVAPAHVDGVLANMMGEDHTQVRVGRSRKDFDIDVPYSGFLEQRAEIFGDPFYQQLRETNLDQVLIRHIRAVVKRAEFNRFLGQDSRALDDPRTWNPVAKYEAILDEAAQEGATREQLVFMKKAVDAMLGRHGREIPDSARTVMAWLMTYQNVSKLLFATLASFPDIVGPAIRSNDFKGAFGSIAANFKDLVAQSGDVTEVARTWGIVTDTLQQHVVTEYIDNHWYPQSARKINEQFFRWTGLERWTNFTRAAALAVGRDFVKRKAAEGDREALSELGLTPEDIATWVENGERTFGADGYPWELDVGTAADRKVAEALVQFTNESIMRPNPSQRPLWASHPGFMLVFHLKSFFYAFHDTFMRNMVHNMERAGTPWQKAYVLAVPATAILMMAALGLELREAIQYKLWGRPPRTARMSGPEYIYELLQRSGMFGPGQLAIDWETADERGQLGAAAVAGPTISQINELISKPASQSIPKAIPVVGQIPALRDWVRSNTPL